MSATAERDGMHLIAVIMGSPTRDERNNAARTLLDYGFAAYSLYKDDAISLERVPVYKAAPEEVSVYSTGFSCLLPKNEISKVEKSYNIPEFIAGTHASGDKVGEIIYTVEGREIGRADIVVYDDIRPLSLWNIFLRILASAIN